mmetsp:Transcript_32732/g.76460  ORF Transcript_32732/g.76460 Transcript_32732/m.76460 type:complete len:282 (-) Transcript_32732:275-1120(-)
MVWHSERSLAIVELDELPKLRPVLLPKSIRVLHRHLESKDAVDVELWCPIALCIAHLASFVHDLVVQVEHDAANVGKVHILPDTVVDVLLLLRTVLVEGHQLGLSRSHAAPTGLGHLILAALLDLNVLNRRQCRPDRWLRGVHGRGPVSGAKATVVNRLLSSAELRSLEVAASVHAEDEAMALRIICTLALAALEVGCELTNLHTFIIGDHAPASRRERQVLHLPRHHLWVLFFRLRRLHVRRLHWLWMHVRRRLWVHVRFRRKVGHRPHRLRPHVGRHDR